MAIQWAHSEADQQLGSLYLDWWESENQKRRAGEVRFDGLDLFVGESVFSPDPRLTFSSTLAAQHLRGLKGKAVLDIATGCGALAIVAARANAATVTAVDIDLAAVENAERNVRRYRLTDKVKVFRSDLFSDVTDKYDVIVANLPIAFSSTAWSHLQNDLAVLLKRFCADLRDYMREDGNAYLTWASFGDQNLLPDLFKTNDLTARQTSVPTFGVNWQIYDIAIT